MEVRRSDNEHQLSIQSYSKQNLNNNKDLSSTIILRACNSTMSISLYKKQILHTVYIHLVCRT